MHERREKMKLAQVQATTEPTAPAGKTEVSATSQIPPAESPFLPPVVDRPQPPAATLYSLKGRIYYKDYFSHQVILNPFTMANYIRRSCFNDGGYCLAWMVQAEKPGPGDEQIVFHFPDCENFPQDIADFIFDRDWSEEDIRQLLFGLMSPTGDPKDYQRTGPVGSITKETKEG